MIRQDLCRIVGRALGVSIHDARYILTAIERALINHLKENRDAKFKFLGIEFGQKLKKGRKGFMAQPDGSMIEYNTEDRYVGYAKPSVAFKNLTLYDGDLRIRSGKFLD